MIRQTSVDAYVELISSGMGSSQMDTISRILLRKGYPMSLKEISRISGIEINSVSGRVNELKSRGYVVECDRRRCSVTGKNVTPVTLAREQAELPF